MYKACRASASYILVEGFIYRVSASHMLVPHTSVCETLALCMKHSTSIDSMYKALCKHWLYLRDFYSFDKMLVHLKFQTCLVLPGLINEIRSFQKIPLKLNEFDPVMYNHVYVYRIRQFQCIL